MESALLIVHIMVAIAIVGLVLIQHGKGADAGAAFGAGGAGGASGSVFGAQGSGNFLSRSTGILATLFFLTSLSLAYMAKNVEGEKSLMERTQDETPIVQVEPKKDGSDAPMVPESAPASDSTAANSEMPSIPEAGDTTDVPPNAPGKP